MTLANLKQQLTTPGGFATAVESKSRLLGTAYTLLGISAIGVGLNLFDLGQASDWDWPIMFRYFFDAGAIEFTGRGAGKGAFYHTLAVWAPVILVPIAVVLIILHFVKRNQGAANLFADFQARGWVGAQRPIDLQIKNGNQTFQLALIGEANEDMSSLDLTANQYNQYLATLDKAGKKQVDQAVQKAKAGKGTVAANVDPRLAGQLLIAPVQKSALVAVITPQTQNGDFKILPIKTSV